MAEPERAPDGEALSDWEQAADELIAAFEGDTRRAIVALLIGNDFLERELDLTRDAVSFGYSRGWHRNRGKIE